MKLPTSEQYLYFFNKWVSWCINLGKKLSTTEVNSILVVKLDEIGDVVTSLHVFDLLHQRYPGAKITAMVKPFCTELVSNHPSVANIIHSSAEWNGKYDVIIELRGTWKTLCKAIWFRPKLRFDRGSVRLKNRGKQQHEVDTNYQIIQPLLLDTKWINPEVYTSTTAVDSIKNWLAQNQLEKYCILHVGARRELRRWPAHNFAMLADFLSNRGLQVVFIGTKDEENQIFAVQNHMKSNSYLFTQNFSLQQLAELMKNAVFFAGNESGPLQIADSLNLPLLALYGPGVPTVFYPRNPHAKVIHHILHCNPCDQVHCVRPENTCMQMISTAEVLAITEEILSKKGNA